MKPSNPIPVLTRRAAVAPILGMLLLASCGGRESPDEAATPSGDAPRVLRFSAIPDRNSSQLEARFRPVAEALSKALDVPVEYVPVVDYPATVAAFRQGEIQLAWFGGLTGCQAREAVPGARAIAQGAADPKFRSYFIAHRDTGLERSEDFPLGLEGRSFSFGSESSTSGRLMPEAFLRRFTGRSPREFFGELPQFSGAHDLTALAVQSGSVEAGALNYRSYDGMVERGEIDPEVCRVIWVSPEYADYNWTAHPVLEEWFGEGFLDRVQQALLSIEDPELLAAMDREALIPATNDDYRQLAETARELNMLR